MEIKTLHDFIHRLSSLSAEIRAMDFASDIPEEPLVTHMYNFANRQRALEEVAITVHTLSVDLGLPGDKLTGVVKPLFTKKTFYGAYHELGVYRWLNDHRFDYEPQPDLEPGQTLKQGGTPDLDGCFTYANVYFDVKSFGFQYHLKEEYRAKLQKELSARVLINGPMNASLSDIRHCALEDVARLANVLDELRNTGRSKIPELHWDISIPTARDRVTIEMTSSRPYQVAEENRHYPFNFAKKFTRNDPFLLIFAFDHLFNGPLHENFANHADIFFRSMCRRVFIQFQSDTTPISQLGRGYGRSIDGRMTLQKVASLLSGILFVDTSNQQSWLYTNPNAANAISDHRIEEMFDFRWPPKMEHDDFIHDNY